MVHLKNKHIFKKEDHWSKKKIIESPCLDGKELERYNYEAIAYNKLFQLEKQLNENERLLTEIQTLRQVEIDLKAKPAELRRRSDGIKERLDLSAEKVSQAEKDLRREKFKYMYEVTGHWVNCLK